MSDYSLQAISLPPDATVRETMETINQAPSKDAIPGVALVTDADEKLLGVITDGDIRKALVSGSTLESTAAEIMTTNPISVSSLLSHSEMLVEMKRKVSQSAHIAAESVKYLLVTDEAGKVVEVLDTEMLERRVAESIQSIAVVGLGFVGLTLAVSLADVGYQVVGVDSNEEIAARIRRADPHFFEQGLNPLLKHRLGSGDFTVEADMPAECDIYIIAVGTPIGPDGRPGLKSVESASRAVAGKLKSGDLVLLRSTVPVGTSRDFVRPILEEESGLTCGTDFFLAFAPERTVEGNALKELKSLPQIVGGFDARSTDRAASCFSRLAGNIVRVDSLEAAEMAKLINNSFRDLSFAFANEFAMICDLWNVDATNVITAANMGYPRNPIPLPSPGVGGFCLTKDPIIYAYAGRDRGYEPRLPIAGREVNDLIVGNVAQKVNRFLSSQGSNNASGKVLIVGMAFKGRPETSDIRHSTSVDLIPKIDAATVWGFDPVVDSDGLQGLGIETGTLEEGFDNADVVVVMNNHESYSRWDLPNLLSRLKKPALLIDGWSLFSRKDVEAVEGVTYEGLSGRH